MLARIEIDGFKTFRDFALGLPPFLVVLGRNGAGKSNLFDALRFLSRLAAEPVAEAAQQARGDLLELFHQGTDGRRSDRMACSASKSRRTGSIPSDLSRWSGVSDRSSTARSAGVWPIRRRRSPSCFLRATRRR